VYSFLNISISIILYQLLH